MSEPGPVISVVVPTKGRPRYLRGCLSALAAADYPRDSFEVVVVNDRGGLDVQRLASSFGSQLNVRLVAPDRTGPSAARNAGALVSRGRYVAFTDDDCEPTPAWLRELQRCLEDNPGSAVGGATRNGAAQSAAAASQMVVDAVHAHFNREPASPRFFASYNLAFPTEPYLALGGFDERFRYAEDREMCERWLSSGHRFVHAPEALVYHMRRLTLREFLDQHHGYGRGAAAFHRSRAPGQPRRSDRAGVLRALTREAVRGSRDRHKPAIAAYVALSQLATAAGFAREAIAGVLPPRRAPH
jgi:glycosyltransferase involved in cell wall biosynthesis